jgi:hypothetical protein
MLFHDKLLPAFCFPSPQCARSNFSLAQQSKKDTTSNVVPKDKETRTATTNTPAGETVTAEQPKPQEGKVIISLLPKIGADLYLYRFWL